MNERGVDAVDAMCDLLLEEDLRVNQVTSGPWTKTMHHFVVTPGRACSERTRRSSARSRRHGRTARIRACWASSSATRALLGLEEAVRKMTSAPAARLGLTDRGLLRDGY